jgi:Tol biopolymer transport system component
MKIDPGRVARGALALCCALLLGIHSVPLSAQEISGFELALVDLEGKKQVLATLPTSILAPRVAPDGKRVAFELGGDSPPASGPPVQRLYVAELNRLDQRRALPMVGKGRNWAPIWSPDGERLVFLVSGESPDALWWRRADGTGEAEQLVVGRAPEGITANGKQLAFITRKDDDNDDYAISLLDIGSKTVKLLVDAPGSEQHSSRISPDGRWIAYSSNETGRQEVWVEPLPPTGQRYRMTQTGGRHPLWSPDGSALFFDQDGQMFRMEISLAANSPKAGEPKGLPIKGFQQGPRRRQFDLMPDGKRFVMLFPLR